MSRWQTQKQNEQKQKGEGGKWEQMEIKNFHTELKNEREGGPGGIKSRINTTSETNKIRFKNCALFVWEIWQW